MTANGPGFDAILTARTSSPSTPNWPVGSRLDAWWSSRPPGLRTALRWAAPTAVLATAAATRLLGLGEPHEVMFDETYYVKDAWTTWNLGYEATWPGDPTGADRYWADHEFEAGRTEIYTDEGSFAVHPPLGKWLIALGMALFGPASSFGWRFAVAIAGIALVVMVMVVAHRLTRSLIVASLAGGLLAIDGNGIVMSRVALLDVFLALFALIAFWFVLLDRERTARTGALWARPWLVAAGAALGAATAVKWSGLWFIAFFGVWVFVADALVARGWWDSLRRGVVAFVLIVPVALAVYLVTWSGWFATDGGYYRHWADDNPATGFWSWLPPSLQSFAHHQGEVLRFHSGLDTTHSYRSPAWAWLLLVRPTAVWYQASAAGDPGCGADACGALITILPNPLIWYASVAAMVWLVIVAFRRADRTAWALIVGFAAGFLPWLAFPERTTYFFYSIAYQPYLVIALAIALHRILGRPDDERSRRRSGMATVAVFLVAAVGLSIYFWPIWTGATLDAAFLAGHYWSPTWA